MYVRLSSKPYHKKDDIVNYMALFILGRGEVVRSVKIKTQVKHMTIHTDCNIQSQLKEARQNLTNRRVGNLQWQQHYISG